MRKNAIEFGRIFKREILHPKNAAYFRNLTFPKFF